MPGGIIELVSKGIQDQYLIGSPQISFFTAIYRRHTNFAIESIELFFDGVTNFGTKNELKICSYGDLLSQCYLELRLPKINRFPDNTDFYVSWANGIGHAIINFVEIEIGGVIIDKHYNRWLNAWYELTVPDSQRNAFNDLVGYHENYNCASQQGALELYVPLQFWFCRNIGLSLPLIAIQNHEIKLKICFNKFDNMWCSSNGLFLDEIPKIEKASIWADYIFLDNEERRKFALNSHTYLIEQVQYNVVSVDTNKFQDKIDLDFNHPVKELIFFVQDCVFLHQNPNSGGGAAVFYYGDRTQSSTSPPEDPITYAKILFNGIDRFHTRPAKFFRVIQPYQYHTHTPNSFIYVYSFALKPEEHQPTGTCNFSQLDSAVLNIFIKPYMTQPQIFLFGPNYNILQVSGGMCGLLYAD